MNDTQFSIDDCLTQLDQGTLTRQHLQKTFDLVTGCERRQDLLYLQACESSLHATLLGFRLLVDGTYVDEPDSDEKWPYDSVIDAIGDGWRVISFPNMALYLDENRTYGLGFEFILEKWT